MTAVRFTLNSLPHYRGALFRCLSEHEGLTVSVATGRKIGAADGIPEADAIRDVVELSEREFLGRAYWQSGVVRHAWRSPRHEVQVFTGDYKCVSTWAALVICRGRGVPSALWTHGWTRRDGALRRIMKHRFYSLADGLILYSIRAQKLGEEAGYRKPMHVVFNSERAELQPYSSPAARRSAERWITVGRLTATKRIDQVIRAQRAAGCQGRRVELTVVGEGPMAAQLHMLSEELGCNVRFAGAMYDKARVDAIISDSDILVSPGNVGLAAIHALALGIPVATSGSLDEQMPEIEAIDDGVTGVLFDSASPEAMSQAIGDFLASHEPSEVARSARAEVSARWLAPTQAARLRTAVESLAAGRLIRKDQI